MFDMGFESLAMLPVEEKMKYWQGNGGGSAGYKAVGATTVSPDGKKDFSEMINVSTADVLSHKDGQHTHRYPPALLQYMESTIKPYVQGCITLSAEVLHIFEEKLGLPKDALIKKHPEVEDPEDTAGVSKTGSEARIVRVPRVERKETDDPDKVIGVGSHTDFGSLVRTQCHRQRLPAVLSPLCSLYCPILLVDSRCYSPETNHGNMSRYAHKLLQLSIIEHPISTSLSRITSSAMSAMHFISSAEEF